MNLDFRCERALEGARAFTAALYDAHQCGECQYAELFALEERAECVAAGNDHFGQIRLVTSPACRRFAKRPVACVMMATFDASARRSAQGVARAS